MARRFDTRGMLLAAVLCCGRTVAGCGGAVPSAPEEAAPPPATAAEPSLEVSVSDTTGTPDVESATPPDGPASTPDPTETNGTEAGATATDALVVCHCLTYPERTGGTTVAIQDCFATEGECADARAARRRRRGDGDPPVPACETASRRSCGQAVFED